MSQFLINRYLTELAKLRQVGGTHRESVVREAFKDLFKSRRGDAAGKRIARRYGEKRNEISAEV